MNKLALIQPVEDANIAEITVGNSEAKIFVPERTVTKWDGEAFFKMEYTDASIKTMKNATVTPDINFEQNKIVYSDGISDVYFYEKSASQEHPEGAYEVEFILKEKPMSNVITTDIETKNLDFFYQPELNVEMAFSTCTETDCGGSHRSENVVGSYAVYYKDGKSGDYTAMGGKNYRSGKALYI